MTSRHTAPIQWWTGRVLSILIVLFMLYDSVIRFGELPDIITTTVEKPVDSEQHMIHGFIILIPTIFYAIPKTSVFGAILLTIYLGGVATSHLLSANPEATHLFFPIYIALFVWSALWLQEPSLRRLLPVIKTKN